MPVKTIDCQRKPRGSTRHEQVRVRLITLERWKLGFAGVKRTQPALDRIAVVPKECGWTPAPSERKRTERMGTVRYEWQRMGVVP